MKVMHGQQEPVHHRIDAVLVERVTANRQRLVPIVKTVLFCGRQKIALRGHHYSDKQTKANACVNHVTFRALLVKVILHIIWPYHHEMQYTPLLQSRIS